MKYLEIQTGHVTRLKTAEDLPEAVHEFETNQIRAVNAAIAAGRPLLVRGEPGIGKSQLAKAVAVELGRAFIPQVVDSRTESRDLLWHFDAVARLADAQIQRYTDEPKQSDQLATDKPAKVILPLANYLEPRALWWAFDWASAQIQADKLKLKKPECPDDWTPEQGCVVLIDEVDKAESDVPNGLLEALGSNSFQPQGLDYPVVAKGTPPLVVITTNEERSLPDAFIRRCLVLHLKLPEARDRLIAKLIDRGRAHFGNLTSDAVLQGAAKCVADDRQEASDRHWLPLPGQAEYLDLLRAVIRQRKDDHAAQEQLIGEIKRFVLRKHPDSDEAEGEQGS